MLHDCMLFFIFVIFLHLSFICLIYLFTDFSLEFGQYIKDSIDQIVKFFESNTAVSQTIALETAAAVQVLFDLTSLLFREMLIVKAGIVY